jgi:hypothetical protein
MGRVRPRPNASSTPRTTLRSRKRTGHLYRTCAIGPLLAPAETLWTRTAPGPAWIQAAEIYELVSKKAMMRGFCQAALSTTYTIPRSEVFVKLKSY